MPAELSVRSAGPADRAFAERILGDNGLPVEDLSEELDRLYVGETETGRIGVGGLERYEDVALLRSVAIDGSARGSGYGSELCLELLDRARDAGVSEVYLLTTTAEAFFARLGFARTDRETVPDPIRGTTEFSEICPASAVCMKRHLDGPCPDEGATT